MLAGAAPALALDANGLKITPSIGYKGEFDDNVFRTKNDRKGDYANFIIPAVKFEANPGRHVMSAEFRAEIIRWSKHNNLDTERFFGDLLGNWKFNRLETWAKEGFRWTDDFPSTEITRRIRRFENDLNFGGDYDIVPQVWGVGLDFLWNHKNYLESATNSLDENMYTYAANAYYKLTGKSRIFLEYAFVDDDFPSSTVRDNTRHRVQLGVKGDLAERFSVTGKAGYEHTGFHDPGQKDQDNFIGSLDMKYQPLERLGLGLLMSYGQPTAVYGNNLIYTSFNTTFLMTYQFTPKFTIIPRANIGFDNYREIAAGATEKREDWLYGVGLSLRYEVFKWLRFDASYDFSAKNSNFDLYDYNDNKVNFSITFSM
jgi:hypothetical protein